MKRFLPKSELIRSVAVLSSGAAASQVMVVAASPLLTRLYSPEDFGLLAFYTGVVSVVGTISALTYDGAIPLPKYDRPAANVVALSLTLITIVALLCAVVLAIWGEAIAIFFNVAALIELQWLIPIGVAAVGYLSVLSNWAVRRRNFVALARNRVARALSQIVVQIGAAFTPFATFGLLFGQLLGQGGSLTRLSRPLFGRDRHLWRGVSARRIAAAASRFRRFPTYSLIAATFRMLNVNAPIFLLAYFFGPAVSGFYLLARRTGSLPIELVGNALTQSMHRSLAEARFRNAVGETVIGPVLTFARLLVAPAMLAALVIPDVVEVVFGGEWRTAGLMLRWLTPWLFTMLIFSPMSPIAAIMEWQREALIYQVTSFVLSVGVMMFLAGNFGAVPAIAGFAMVNATTMMVYRLTMLHRLGCSLRPLINHIFGQLLIFASCFALMVMAQDLTGWLRWSAIGVLGVAALSAYVVLNFRATEGLNAALR